MYNLPKKGYKENLNLENDKVGNSVLLEIYRSKFSKSELEFVVNDIIKDRYILIVPNNCQLVIGNNKKEVENGYFDIKFCIEDNRLVIYVNKLFKNSITSNQNSIIENEYINEIINLVLYVTNITLNEKDISFLKERIIESYINIRSVENVDNIEEKIKEQSILNNIVNSKLEYKDNMIKISL